MKKQFNALGQHYLCKKVQARNYLKTQHPVFNAYF